MANKTIAELQLIDEVTSGVSVPVDDGIQTYRATAAQIKSFILANQNILLAMLDEDIFTGLTAVTPADDDYFPLVDTSDSNKTKKGLVGAFRNSIYRSVVTTDAVGVGDETMKLSGASFTSTLPTAVGVTGKRYKYIHAGTSLTQVYTLATTSGQTIGGIASGAYSLYTNGEVLELESDGANWIIINHFAQTPWVDAGVMTITAESVNPVKDGTVAIDKVYWRRNGKDVDIIYKYFQVADTGAATTGTGIYRWALPSGITADTAIIAATGAALDSDLIGTDDLTSMIGRGYVTSNANKGPAVCVLRTSTTFSVGAMQGVSAAATPIQSSGNYDLTNGNISYNFRISGLPVDGWQP